MIHDRRWGRSERTRHQPLCGSTAFKLRQTVHGHRTLAPRCLVEIVPVRFIIACVAEPRYVAAYRLQNLSGRRVVLTDQQNNCRAKILLSLRMVGNAWPMLRDNVLNRIRRDPTCGEYLISIVSPDDSAFSVEQPLPVLCNPEVRDLLRRYETCQVQFDRAIRLDIVGNSRDRKMPSGVPTAAMIHPIGNVKSSDIAVGAAESPMAAIG